ncbi:MAG: gas vesicle protein GvpO [Eubacteriales bacterium]
MEFIQIRDKVLEFISGNFSQTGKIIELVKKENKWVSHFEIIEESEYVRKFAKTDLVGLYEVELDDNGMVMGFKRMHLRERTDIGPIEPSA